MFDSLRKLTYTNVEIILVDNASTDDSVSFTRTNYPEVKIIENERNYMFARGNNEGIKNARGEILCLINNDVIVEPGLLEPVLEAFRTHRGMAVCQPKVLDMFEPNRFEYAGAAGGFIDRYGYPFLRGRLFFTLEQDAGQYDTDIDILWASGACFFIRQSALKHAGLLDEDFVLHMEEIDLCWRLHLYDWQIRCVTAAKVWHKGGGTLSAENPRKVYWNYRNNIFLLVKNLSVSNLIKIILARIFLDLAAFVGEVVRGNARSAFAILQAYRWVISHIALLRAKRRQTQLNRRVNDSVIYRLIYPGSIVWEYFVRGRKTFSQLRRRHRLLYE